MNSQLSLYWFQLGGRFSWVADSAGWLFQLGGRFSWVAAVGIYCDLVDDYFGATFML